MDKLFVASLSNYFQKKDEKISTTCNSNGMANGMAKFYPKLKCLSVVYGVYMEQAHCAQKHKQKEGNN